MASDSITLRVPATSANLGPGFDALGLALELAADIYLTLAGPARKPRDVMERMIVSAARETYKRAGATEPPALTARVLRPIPLGRGLGASAVARAAGVIGANTLLGGPLDDAAVLALAAELEGHADNVAPAVLGGLQVVVAENGRLTCVGVPVPAELRVVLYVPEFSMPTHESRKRLPSRLTREDAVYNIGRAALLVATVAAGRFDAMRIATQDRLHQPVRAGLFPVMPAIIDAALGAGAHAAYLSGGGSTIAAWATSEEERIGRAMADAAAAANVAGQVIHTRPSARGAYVIPEGEAWH